MLDRKNEWKKDKGHQQNLSPRDTGFLSVWLKTPLHLLTFHCIYFIMSFLIHFYF